jgi:hypothetical protein
MLENSIRAIAEMYCALFRKNGFKTGFPAQFDRISVDENTQWSGLSTIPFTSIQKLNPNQKS